MQVYLNVNNRKFTKDENLFSNYSCVLKVRVEVGDVIKIDSMKHPNRYNWFNNGFDTAWHHFIKIYFYLFIYLLQDPLRFI